MPDTPRCVLDLVELPRLTSAWPGYDTCLLLLGVIAARQPGPEPVVGAAAGAVAALSDEPMPATSAAAAANISGAAINYDMAASRAIGDRQRYEDGQKYCDPHTNIATLTWPS
jgi:hypothetical protein